MWSLSFPTDLPSFGMVYPKYVVSDTARTSRGRRHRATRMGSLSSATALLSDLGRESLPAGLSFLTEI